MPPEALVMVLSAALMHAAWNALAKRARNPIVFLWSSVSIASIALLPAGIWMLLATVSHPTALVFVGGTIVLHGAYFYTLGRAYSAGELSAVYPVARGLGVALVPIIAFAALDERVSPAGAAGIALVIAGIVVIHSQRAALPIESPSVDAEAAAAVTADGPRPGRRAGAGAGVGWAVLTGILIAAYSAWDKAAVTRVHPVAYIAIMGVGISLLLLPVVLRHGGALRDEWRQNRRSILVAATMNLSSYLLVLFAFRLSKAGYVVAARETSIVISVLLGTLWMKEGKVTPRLLGALVVLLGVGCIALAR